MVVEKTTNNRRIQINHAITILENLFFMILKKDGIAVIKSHGIGMNSRSLELAQLDVIQT